MIPILAWRNVWRNPTRSFVVMAAIALGIWAAMFMSGFATGMAQSYIDNSIQNLISHLQVHHPRHAEDQDVQYTISDPEAIRLSLDQMEGVKYSVRTISNGMIASSHSSRGVEIRGIDPAQENGVIGMAGKITEGDYFAGDRKNQILISQRMADKLNAKLRSRLVLTFQDVEREITAAAFRVVGIFDTQNNPFDDNHVLVRRADLNRLLAAGEGEAPTLAHEIAILLPDGDSLAAVQQDLQAVVPDMLVQTYRQIAPDVQLYESMIGSVSLIYLTIIMLALVFGIINTMLMAVLERFKELGMLMAIGMNKLRVFSMIVLETIMLSLIGAPIGLLLGWGTTALIAKYGLNLSAFSSTMEMYGLSDIVYFEHDPKLYGQVAVAVALTAIIASIYPAFKAIRLKPVEAIHKI